MQSAVEHPVDIPIGRHQERPQSEKPDLLGIIVPGGHLTEILHPPGLCRAGPSDGP